MNKYQRWKQGMKDLTPEAVLKAKLIGQWGSVVGVIFGWATMWYYGGLWYFSVLMFFVLFLQLIELKVTYQQYKALKSILTSDEKAIINKLMEGNQ